MIYFNWRIRDMVENSRNRSEGWKYAKLSGHSNEELVKQLLDNDKKYACDFLARINATNQKIRETSIGGLHETNVPSITGKTTKSKTDLKVFLENGSTKNISIKKSLGGQVYFVRAGNFIDVFEKQFNKIIPRNVHRAIKLFWAEADDALEIIRKYGDKSDKKNYEQQIRHHSLNAITLKNYDTKLYDALLNWFKTNIYELTNLAFTMGAAKDSAEWPEFIWYINLVGETNPDDIFNIRDICKISKKYAETETDYGTINGGTTIQLPFGFVQWHQHQLQFHHQYWKIKKLLSR